MRVLFVTDSPDPGERTPPPSAPRSLAPGIFADLPLGDPVPAVAPVEARGVPDAHADTDLVDALRAAGVQVTRAGWMDVARGRVDLDGVDLVHLRPAPLRRGPRTGDRRADQGAGLFGSFRRRRVDDDRGAAGFAGPSERRGGTDRRSAVAVLDQLPPELPVVVTLPAPPAGAMARSASGPVPAEVPTAAADSRPVWVIAADTAAADGLASVLPHTHPAGVAVIGRGFGEPVRARAFDVDTAVVLAVVSPGSAAEGATVLRAAEALAHAGLRFSLVVAGVGPTIRGISRRVAMAEAAGIDVRLLGRASAEELARWRATAAVCVLGSCEPGVERDLAELLLSGVPVVAALSPVHAEVAAQSSVPPGWFAPGDVTGLAAVLHEQLGAAGAAVPPRSTDDSGPAVAPARTGSAAAAAPAAPDAAAQARVADQRRLAVLEHGRAADRVLPRWSDIAEQTRWVYELAVRGPRG